FSLGIVLHELVTGKRLYKREGHARVVDAIREEPAMPPSRAAEGCPRSLDDACQRALEKAPDDRYANAADMRRDLLEVARDVVDPTEALAQMMRRLFEDRITEKTALVADVRANAPTTVTPRRSISRKIALGVAGAVLVSGSLLAWRVSRARAVASGPPPP